MATAAGYILTENGRIWGIGETLAQAKADARRQGAYLDHDGEELDDWVDTLRVRPATAALLAAARQDRWTEYKRLTGDFWSTTLWGASTVWGTPAELATEEGK